MGSSVNPPKALRQPREGTMEDLRTTQQSDPAVMASHESYSSTLMHRSGQKKWCHRASLRSTSCSGKTTVPSGSTSNSGACANRASSGQLEDVRHPCITRGQWGGMPRPWRPTAGSCRRRQARAMKGRRTTLICPTFERPFKSNLRVVFLAAAAGADRRVKEGVSSYRRD